MPRHGQLTDESGFALLESIVAAALLAVMVVAVFTTFDTVSRVSGQSKARATAASIAQREQEYMRALPVSQLSTIADKTTPTTSTDTVDNITYTITRSARWLPNDDAQTTSCTADPNRPGDYMKIVSTVTAPAVAGIKPVRLSSVVSPPAGSFGAGQGSLAFTVMKADGSGQPGVAVTLSNGLTSTSRTTDAQGCAFFGYQKVGAYTVVPFAVGMVDPSGKSNPTPQPVNIAPETISTASVQYDVAGTRNVVFKTQALDANTGALTTSIVPAKARIVTFAPPGSLPARTFGDGATRVDKIAADHLFPFTSNYAVYAGDCSAAKPSPDLVAAPPRPAAPAAEPAVGAADVQLLMPALAFSPVLPSGTSTTPVAGASIILTAKSTGCAGTFQLGGTGTVTNIKGLLAGAGTTAVPFGTYDYCVKDAANHTVKGTVAVDNTKVAGAAVTLARLSSTTTATCPVPT